MRRFKTKVITDESQVPDGFKRISVLADSLTDQKKLSDAHTDGVIAAVKLMRSTDDRTGPVWVDADAARQVLTGDKPKAKAKQQTDLQYESVCESMADIATSLAGVERLLERLDEQQRFPRVTPQRRKGRDDHDDCKHERPQEHLAEHGHQVWHGASGL
jgi:hypothetical protein